MVSCVKPGVNDCCFIQTATSAMKVLLMFSIFQSYSLASPAVPYLANISAWESSHCILGSHVSWWFPRCNEETQEAVLKAWPEDIQYFAPGQLFATLEGKTLWIVGDSTMQQLFRATVCALREYIVPGSVFLPPTYDDILNRELRDWTKHDAECIALVNSTRVCCIRSDYATSTIEKVFPALFTVAESTKADLQADFFVVNFGLHYSFTAEYNEPNKTRAAEHYVPDLMLFSSFVSQHNLSQLFFETVIPQHFNEPGGLYVSKGDHSCSDRVFKEWQANEEKGRGWLNDRAIEVLKPAGIPIIDTWRDTISLWFAHLGPGDCTHMCHPGSNEARVARMSKVLSQHSAVDDLGWTLVS